MAVFAASALGMPAGVWAQAAPGMANGGKSERIVLVLPFDNRTGQPNLEWIREASAEILTRRLRSAGFAPMSREDRLYALDHLGLPAGFQPSRASALKLAETVDADSIVVGSYRMDGTEMVAEAQLVDVPHLRMSEAIAAKGEMRDLIGVFAVLAWKLTHQLDPGFSVAQETFVAAGTNVRLDAFEEYIHGITDPEQDERLRRLKHAVQLNPELASAWMAMGREEFAREQYEDAAKAFSHVDQGEPDAPEAKFDLGLAEIYSGNYTGAEAAFSGVAKTLPLAEVLNNEGVALSRQGKDGRELFRQAIAADPAVADFHFNLAISLKRHGDSGPALSEMDQDLRLRPSDSEAQAVERIWKGLPPEPGKEGETAVKADPLVRLTRTFNAQAYRQAAEMMEQMETERLAALPAHERAEKLAAQGEEYLNRGMLLEAERMYQLAASADGGVGAAHAGLAEVRERAGDADGARKEAQAALELSPSAQAYSVLGRLELAAGHMDEAKKAAAEALQVDPASPAAKELERQIEGKQGGKT